MKEQDVTRMEVDRRQSAKEGVCGVAESSMAAPRGVGRFHETLSESTFWQCGWQSAMITDRQAGCGGGALAVGSWVLVLRTGENVLCDGSGKTELYRVGGMESDWLLQSF